MPLLSFWSAPIWRAWTQVCLPQPTRELLHVPPGHGDTWPMLALNPNPKPQSQPQCECQSLLATYNKQRGGMKSCEYRFRALGAWQAGVGAGHCLSPLSPRPCAGIGGVSPEESGR